MYRLRARELFPAKLRQQASVTLEPPTYSKLLHFFLWQDRSTYIKHQPQFILFELYLLFQKWHFILSAGSNKTWSFQLHQHSLCWWGTPLPCASVQLSVQLSVPGNNISVLKDSHLPSSIKHSEYFLNTLKF